MDNQSGSAVAGNPAAPAAGSTNAAPSGQSGQWFDGLPEDVRGTVQTKGWQSPADVVQSYANLEKLLGADKAGRGIVLPKEDADPSEWGQVYDRLGRPKSADEYKLPVPDGDTGEFAKVAAGKFHELGLSAKQAAGLAEWWNSQSAAMQQQQFNASAQDSESQMAQLQQEWGKEYDANVEAARRATRQFGVQTETLEKIENAIGTKELMKLFANIGRGVGEDTFVQGKGGGNFGISPEAARVRIGQLKADKEWSAKYLGGNADAKAEMERLMRAAYPQ